MSISSFKTTKSTPFVTLLCRRYITPSVVEIIEKKKIMKAYVFILYVKKDINGALEICKESILSISSELDTKLKQIYILTDFQVLLFSSLSNSIANSLLAVLLFPV